MEPNRKVSIIIPVYKVEDFLEKCLTSVREQTYTNLEVICVNDGSPDRSGDIIESFVNKDTRFIHLKKENEGVTKVRQSGLAIATGEYISYLDGDDYLMPDFIDKMVTALENSGSDMAFSNFVYYHSESNQIRSIITLQNGEIVDYNKFILNVEMYGLWGRLYKKELVMNLREASTTVGEDYWATMQILVRCNKIIFIDEVLYIYRRDNVNSIMNNVESIVPEIEHTIALIGLLKELNISKEAYRHILFNSVIIITKYCNRYHFGVVDRCGERIKILINLISKEYPYMFWRNLNSRRYIILNIIFYTVKYMPCMVKYVYQYHKMRGKLDL